LDLSAGGVSIYVHDAVLVGMLGPALGSIERHATRACGREEKGED
jgi:hypothetical protein